jgi:hypothetical protein
MMPNFICLVVGVATLALLSSIPAAGQAPKLSTQQLNSPRLNVYKPIAAPNKPIAAQNNPIAVPKALTAYSPNGNKQIATPKAPTIAFGKSSGRRPPRDDGGSGGLSSLASFCQQYPGFC